MVLSGMACCFTEEASDALSGTVFDRDLSWLENIKRYTLKVLPACVDYLIDPDWVTWEVHTKNGEKRPLLIFHFNNFHASSGHTEPLRWKQESMFIASVICKFISENWDEFGFPNKIVSDLMGEDFPMRDFDVFLSFEEPTCIRCGCEGRNVELTITPGDTENKLHCPDCGWSYYRAYGIHERRHVKRTPPLSITNVGTESKSRLKMRK